MKNTIAMALLLGALIGSATAVKAEEPAKDAKPAKAHCHHRKGVHHHKKAGATTMSKETTTTETTEKKTEETK